MFLIFRGGWKWENVFDDSFGNEVIWDFILGSNFFSLRYFILFIYILSELFL